MILQFGKRMLTEVDPRLLGKIAWNFGVPAVFRALVEYAAQGHALDTALIKFCVSAGEKLPESLFYEWKHLTGLDILDGLGSTEMCAM